MTIGDGFEPHGELPLVGKIVNLGQPGTIMPNSPIQLVPKTAQPLGDGIVEELRALLAAVERGEVKALVVAWETDGHYHTMRPSSFQDCLILSTLLQRRALDAMFE